MRKMYKLKEGILFSFFVANAFAGENRTLEEVLVKGNKSAIPSWRGQGIIEDLDYEDISLYSMDTFQEGVDRLPSVHFTQTGISTQVRVRGIGSGNSQGFEQSVGLFLDGVGLPKAQLFRIPMYDTRSVELLKGPQNTLYGKSSIAGVINIQSALPTREFESEVDLAYGSFNYRHAKGYSSGPLTDQINYRLSFYLNDENGAFNNTYLGKEQPQQETKSIRIQTAWVSGNENTTLNFKYQNDAFDIMGRPKEIMLNKGGNIGLDIIARMPGNPNLVSIEPTYSNILSTLFNEPTFEHSKDFNSQFNVDEYSNNSVDNASFKLNHSFPSFDLTTVLGYVRYEYDELCDCDYIPSNLFTLNLNENFEQLSLDTYLTYKNMLLGVYLESYTQKFRDYFLADENSLFGKLRVPLSGTAADRYFKQESEHIAMYASYSFDLNDFGILDLSGRLSKDAKTGAKHIDIVDPATGNILTEPRVVCTYLVGLKVDSRQSQGYPMNCDFVDEDAPNSAGHFVQDEKTKTYFTPSIGYKKELGNETTLFSNLKKGYKAGGFDPRSNNPQSFSFTNESSVYFDLGLRVANSNLDFESSVFSHKIRDMQISQFDGGVGFNVGNAKSIVSRGFDVSFKNSIGSRLEYHFSAMYLFFEYADFENGNCYQGEVPESTGYCDYSGRKRHFTPELKTSTGFNYIFSNAWNGEHDIFGNYSYIGKHNVHDNFDPEGMVGPFNMIDLGISFNFENLSVALVGGNLLDEYVITYLGNAPLSGSSFGTNTHYGFAQEPRNYKINATYRF